MKGPCADHSQLTSLRRHSGACFSAPAALNPSTLPEHQFLQFLTVTEGFRPDASDTSRNSYTLDVTAPEPVITDPLNTIRDDNIFPLPQVLDAHTADKRR